jgi:DNA-directed RNA polymerase specialized sigma24 family protein
MKKQPAKAGAAGASHGASNGATNGAARGVPKGARSGADKTTAKTTATSTATPAPSVVERDAMRALVERNYATLRDIARRKLRRSPMSRTMSPTSLVAEGIVRLMKQRTLPASAPHLSGLATILMAQALSDRAKIRRATKRNSGAQLLQIGTDVPLDRRLGRSGETVAARPEVRRQELVAQMELIGREHPRRMEVVTLHLVLGIPLAEVARMLAISERTAFRELAAGREALALALKLAGKARDAER